MTEEARQAVEQVASEYVEVEVAELEVSPINLFGRQS